MRGIALILLFVPLALPAADASAQVSLLGSTGLGRRVTALDARARGMGNVGVALHGGNRSAVNPASVARSTDAGIWATFMPEHRSVVGEFAEGDFDTEDVPVIRAVFPWGGKWGVAVSAGSYLDQDWGVQFLDTLRLSSGDFAFQETRRSNGGVTQFRLELARAASQRVSVGGAFLYYSGEAQRSVERFFEAGSGLDPHIAATVIDYSGWGLALGVEYQPIPEMIVGATASWGPGLHIENDTTRQELDTDLPLTLDVGGSWELTPDFVVAVALGWEGWSSVADALPNVTATDVLRAGLGLELGVLRGQAARLVVRSGLHADRLPFELRNSAVWERAASFGLGAVLANGRGRLDGTIEFGKRGNADKNDVEESYTRFSFGIAVFSR